MLMMLILGQSVHTTERNKEALVLASKEAGLEMLVELSTWSCLDIRMQDEVKI